MSDSRVSGFSPWLVNLAFVAAVALLTLSAGQVMFSAFMFYDDEGYVLISLRNFAEHGGLYRDVYSQYGPFPYVFYYLLHALGLPFTHTAGRILTVLIWCGASIGCASVVWKESRQLPLRLAVLAAAYVYFWTMASEPTHPGGLIVGITAAMGCLGHAWLGQARTRAWAIMVGAGIAALALTKINIGAFAGMSAFAWVLLHHDNASVRRWAPGFLIAGIAALPFLLMRPLLQASWVQIYAVMFACAGVPAMGAAAMAGSARVKFRSLVPGVIAGGIVSALIVGTIFIRGSSFADLLEGVLLRALRHPVHFNLDFAWPAGVLIAAASSVVLFGLACFLRRRAAERVDVAIAVARIAAALAMAILIARFPAFSPDHLVLSFAVPWLWIFLWPLAGEDRSTMAARNWLGLLFLGQCLHAFPVRGSQTTWGTFLALPVAALGAWQATRWLAARFPNLSGRGRARFVAVQIAVVALAGFTGYGLRQVGQRYYDGRNLDLPGAEQVRLPEKATTIFQVLTLNAVAHADVLFSLPGMYSFNFWSGLPTPTFTNVTHWFSLLDPSQQQKIIAALEQHPRACIIIQREHMDYIARHAFDPGGPLHEYIKSHFTPAFTLDDFEFCVRNGREIQPLMLAQTLVLADPGPEDTVLRMSVLLPPNRTVARVEIEAAPDSPHGALTLNAGNARVEITPINLRSEPVGATETRPWPLALGGRPAAVSIYFGREGKPRPMRGGLVVFRDGAGEEIAIGRLRQ